MIRLTGLKDHMAIKINSLEVATAPIGNVLACGAYVTPQTGEVA